MWIDKLVDNRKNVLISFGVIALISFGLLFTLKFSFTFEQFFPKGDDDLDFFEQFTKEFETDDNFLLVAIENNPTVFNKDFLTKFSAFAKEATELPHVVSTLGLTEIEIPNPLTLSKTKLLDPEGNLEDAKRSILSDERFVYNIINESGTSMVLNIKNEESIAIAESQILMDELRTLLEKYDFEEYHFLGRAYFQDELSNMQKREVMISSFVSIILVSFILLLLYRKLAGVMIALVSIGLGLLIFMGLLGLLGRELNAMAAFYPVLMLIVGTSDVVHIMSKYLDEMKAGASKKLAINTTIREIGKATLMTSLTTSAGFLSLVTSKVAPIRDFGINSALGVMVAYVTVIFFTTALLSYYDTSKLIKEKQGEGFWDKLTGGMNKLTKQQPKLIWLSTVLFLIFCGFGISKVTTNYKIESNLPLRTKITEDFLFFEKEYGGFRPFEFAIITDEAYNATDYSVIKEVEKIEKHLRESNKVKAIVSPVTLYKSINEIFSFDKQYALAGTKEQFDKQTKLIEKLPQMGQAVLFSKDNQKTRLSSRINDLGAEEVKKFGLQIDDWMEDNIDASVISVRRTGTGLILDKNAEYVRDNLLLGLGLALIIVSILMALLFRDIKMLVISLVPNIIPLLFAAAVLGWVGIELEAGISIVFAIVFGIAVDDTIHFLSKFKISRDKGMSFEDAMERTFKETGKAIIFTSIILFFGFLVMLFSIHPPSVTIGLLISITLFSAIIADLLLLPVIMRKWM
jgi:predicted RND superfamily exporter protein